VDTGIVLTSTTLMDQLSSIPDFSAAAPSAPSPEVTEQDVQDVEEDEGVLYDLSASTEPVEPPLPVNLGGDGIVTVTRRDTGEKEIIRYRTSDGGYDMDEVAKFDHIARCSLTGVEKDMSIKLLELLDKVEDHFGKRGLLLLSGYRTPRLNRITPGAAAHSRHMLGWAADIRVPGYTPAAVKRYALKLGVGGVGYYPSQGFTHLDVGRVRYWVVKRVVHRRRKARRVLTAKAAGRRTVRRASAGKAVKKQSATKHTAVKKTAAVKRKRG
jgi:uncharacterized protein YcbK (DUF882 family)